MKRDRRGTPVRVRFEGASYDGGLYMDATARFVAIVAVAAFLTERLVAAIDYVVAAVRSSRAREEGASGEETHAWRQLVMFAVGGVIAYVVVDRANLRILRVLQVDHVQPLVDFWMTWLVVVAGADRVHTFFGHGEEGGGAHEEAEAPVVRVQVDGGAVRELHRVR